MTEIHLRKCSTSLAIMETRIKTSLRNTFAHVRMTKNMTPYEFMLKWIWRKWNTPPLLFGMPIFTATLDISMEIPWEMLITLHPHPESPLLVIYPKGSHSYLKDISSTLLKQHYL